MITPLDVVHVILRKRVENDMRPRPAVVNVAHDVQPVDGQALDYVADGHDESVRPPDGDDRAQDAVEVLLLVGRSRGIGLVEQLLDDVGEVLGQCLAHLGAGVFGRNVAAYLRKLVERDAVPVVQVALLALDKLQFLLGVIDQRAEVAFLGLAERISKNFVHFLPDHARGVFEYVLKCLELPVEVREEMLGSFREVEDRFEIDDFGRRIGHGGEFLGEEPEVFQVGRVVSLLLYGSHGLQFLY